MPFITEEIWQQLPHQGASIMTAPWPRGRARGRDRQAEKIIEHLQEIIVAVRNIRAEMDVPPARRATLLLRVEDPKLLQHLEENRSLLDLARVDRVIMGHQVEKSRTCATAVVKDVEVFVPLEDLIDLEAERVRLQKEIERISGLLGSIQAKLDNRQFVSKAPKEVVDRERTKKEELGQQLEKLKRNLDMLSD
jgi:valyl-tRNA synthetase